MDKEAAFNAVALWHVSLPLRHISPPTASCQNVSPRLAVCTQDLRQCGVPRIDCLFQEVSQQIQLHGLLPVIHARHRRMTYGGYARSCMRFYLDSDQIFAIPDPDPNRYFTPTLLSIRSGLPGSALSRYCSDGFSSCPLPKHLPQAPKQVLSQ